MQQVTVFLNDYPNKKRLAISFTSLDYEKVLELWDQEDQRLLNLQSIPAFKGYERWSQCRTEHFRILIMHTMTMLEGMTDADKQDASHPVMSTFNFFVLGLVHSIELATLSQVEILHVNRLTSRDIAFDFTAVMDMQFALPSPLEDDNPFKIVVDNTKK